MDRKAYAIIETLALLHVGANAGKETEIGLTQKLIQPSPLAPLPQERGTGKIRILRPFSCRRSEVLSLSKEGWGMRGNFALRKS